MIVTELLLLLLAAVRAWTLCAGDPWRTEPYTRAGGLALTCGLIWMVLKL